MEIKASSKFDFETVKAFSHVVTYGKHKPKSGFMFLNIFCVVFLCLDVFVISLRGFENADFLSLFLIAFLFFLNLFIYVWFPKLQFKMMKNVQNMENQFAFCDDVIKVSSGGEMYQGEGVLKYAFITKVLETEQYFFVYQHQNQAYIVNKETISNGTVEEIREKLKQSIQGKYITCKY